MKALILAAGLGERLRPLTLKIPKCLLPVAGRPVLDYWIEACEEAGVSDVLINTHHLDDQVTRYVRSRKSPAGLHLAHEEHLLGSAGTLARNRAFFEGTEPFAILYADNYAPGIDLLPLFRFHGEHGGLLTMGLFESSWPAECGIVNMSTDGRILSFQEKPKAPAGNLANAGIYITDSRLFELLPPRIPSDFGQDLLPSLVGLIHGFPLDVPVVDIGTPERYRRAQSLARSEGGSRGMSTIR